MKKISLILLLSLSSLFSQNIVFEETKGSIAKHIPYDIYTNGKCDQILQRKAYVDCYSYENKIPLFVAYRLTKDEVKGHLKRPSKFFPDKLIPIKYQSKLSDYRRSGYDRGHMMPNAAADWDKQAQLETFLLSNIVPQNGNLNRNAWAYLERAVRLFAKKYGVVYVVTGAVPSKRKFLRRGHVNVPKQMYKIIQIPRIGKTFIYLVPNDDTVKKSEILKSKKYRSSFDEIKKLTDIDFSDIKNQK